MSNEYEYLMSSGAFVGCPGDVSTFARRLREVWDGIPVSGVKPDIYYWHKHYDPFSHTASIGGQYRVQRTSHPSVNPVFMLFGHSIGTPVRPPHEGWEDLRSWLNHSGWGGVSLLGEPDFQDPAHPPPNKIPLSGTMFELFDAIRTGSETDLIIYDLSRIMPAPHAETPEHTQQQAWCERLLMELGKNYPIRRPETDEAFKEQARADLKVAFDLPFRNPLFDELPGLSAEGADDALLFARGDLIKTLSERILDTGASFTRVLGVSGAGKSSLLRAGLMGTWFLRRRGIDANRINAIALLVEPDSLQSLESDPLIALGKLLTGQYAGRETGAVGPRAAALAGPVPELPPPTDDRLQDLTNARTWWAEMTCSHAGPIILILDQAEQIDACAKREAQRRVERDSSLAYVPALSLEWRRFVDLLLNLSGAGEVKLDFDPPGVHGKFRLVLSLHRKSAIDLWGCDSKAMMRNPCIEVPALTTQQDWHDLITQTLAAYGISLDTELLNDMVSEASRLVDERQAVHADSSESLDVRYEQASILPLVKAALQLLLTEWRRRMKEQGTKEPTRPDLHLDRQTFGKFAGIEGAVNELGNRAVGQWYSLLRSGMGTIGLLERENLAREFARRFDHLFMGLIDVGDRAKIELSQISRAGEIALNEAPLVDALRAQRLLTGPDVGHWRLSHRTVVDFWKRGKDFCERYAGRQVTKGWLKSYGALNQSASKWEDDHLDPFVDLAFGWIGSGEGEDASLRQYLLDGLTARFRPEAFALESREPLAQLPLRIFQTKQETWRKKILERAQRDPSWPKRAGLWVSLLASIGDSELLQLATSGLSQDSLRVIVNQTELMSGTFPLLLAAGNGHAECVRLLLERGADAEQSRDKTGAFPLLLAAGRGHVDCVWLLLQHGAETRRANQKNGTFPLLRSAGNGHEECVRLLLEFGANASQIHKETKAFPLLMAAQNDRAECVQLLLEGDAEPDQLNEKTGMFPLLLAAQEGCPECVRLLLEHGAEPNKTREKTGSFPLLQAAAVGRGECLRLLLEHGAEANKANDTSGTLPLVEAAENGYADCVRLLLEHGADANRAHEKTGVFPLLIAVRNGHAVCVRLLLEHGAKASQAHEGGVFPLLLAAETGDAECVRLLLDNGAEANAAIEETGASPLLQATLNGHVECVRLLLEHGARANQVDRRDGTFPLFLAAQNGHEECIRLLLEHGADVNQAIEEAGAFPLLQAAQNGHVECVRLLLEHGAGANRIDKRIDTFPLLQAAQGGHEKCIRLLLEHGADVNHASEEAGAFPLLQAAQNGHADCVRLLLDHGAKASQARQKVGGFPLFLAAQNGHAECIRLLLEHGAKAKQIVEEDGTFSLLLAAQNGHAECVQLLLECGADADQINDTDGLFPLFLAAANNNAPCVRVLLNYGAEANRALQAEGFFPLLVAAENGHKECLWLLLEHGAEATQIHEKNGAFPLLLAAQHGYTDCVRLLLQYGADPNQTNKMTGNFSLLIAAANCHEDCVRSLLERGAEADLARSTDGVTALDVALGRRCWTVARLIAARMEVIEALSDAGRSIVEKVLAYTNEELNAMVGMTAPRTSVATPDGRGENNHVSVSMPLYFNPAEEVPTEQKQQALAACVSRYGIHPDQIEVSSVEAIRQGLNVYGDSLMRLDLTLKSTEMRLQVAIVIVHTGLETRFELCGPQYDLNGLATSMSNLGRPYRLIVEDVVLSWASLWLILKGAIPVLPQEPWPLVATPQLPFTRIPERTSTLLDLTSLRVGETILV